METELQRGVGYEAVNGKLEEKCYLGTEVVMDDLHRS